MRPLLPVLLSLTLAGCGTVYGALGVAGSYEYSDAELDSGLHKHSPTLISALGTPPEASKSQPVVVLAHGFAATEWETQLIADQLRAGGFLVSHTLLGGHGDSVKAFEQSNWKTWGAPVLKEIADLRALGYSKISLVGTSTGCPLLLEGIASGSINPVPERIVLVSPMIEPTSKLIGYTGALGWIGVKTKVSATEGKSKGNWYHNWPATTLTSLLDLSEVIKARLNKGIAMPTTTKVLVLQSKVDNTVDPKAANLIVLGVKGGQVELRMLDSTLHVPLRPDGIDDRNYTAEEATLRTQLLGDIQTFLSN